MPDHQQSEQSCRHAWIKLCQRNAMELIQIIWMPVGLSYNYLSLAADLSPDDNDGGGLNLTESDAADYARWLASEASSRNLAIGLKNAAVIIPKVIDVM